MKYTIRSTQHGVVLGYYGEFEDMETAELVAVNTSSIARRKFNSVSHYEAVPLPEGVQPKRLHPSYTEGIV